MRAPSRTLIVDTNIVMSCALGLQTIEFFEFIGERRLLAVSEHAAAEIRGVSAHMIDHGRPEAFLAPQYLEALTIVSEGEYAALISEAAKTLMLAPASRNGSSADAQVLACAWHIGADIWSHDRDFAGTGWPSWSSANLRAALARETQPKD